MWKFHDFCITQILREIKFGNFRSAKSANFTHLEALNFDFYDFLHLLKAHNLPKVTEMRAPKIAKNGSF